MAAGSFRVGDELGFPLLLWVRLYPLVLGRALGHLNGALGSRRGGALGMPQARNRLSPMPWNDGFGPKDAVHV